METQRPDHNDEQTTLPEGQKRPSGGWSARFRDLQETLLRPVPLATLGLVLIFAVLLGVLLDGDPEAASAVPESDPSVVRGSSKLAVSESYLAGSMEAGVRSIDIALLASLDRLGVEHASIEFLDVRRAVHKGEEFTVQSLHLGNGISALALKRALEESLAGDAFSLRLEPRGELHVLVNGVVTHRFLGAPPPFPPASDGPKVVLVIDDMGENLGVARDLAALSVPIVFAVWPNASHAAEVRRLAVDKGLDLLVHMPMEPLGYPDDNPGSDALFVSMSDEQIAATLRGNLDKVPEAVGLNNHMGSRFTRDDRGMSRVMQTLKERRMFFLDSRTTSRSVGRATARAVDLPFYGRDVFLDNSLSVPAILLQLRKAERLALRNGHCIAIGHPHSQTVQAIRLWLAERDPAVVVAPLTSLSPQ